MSETKVNAAYRQVRNALNEWAGGISAKDAAYVALTELHEAALASSGASGEPVAAKVAEWRKALEGADLDWRKVNHDAALETASLATLGDSEDLLGTNGFTDFAMRQLAMAYADLWKRDRAALRPSERAGRTEDREFVSVGFMTKATPLSDPSGWGDLMWTKREQAEDEAREVNEENEDDNTIAVELFAARASSPIEERPDVE